MAVFESGHKADLADIELALARTGLRLWFAMSPLDCFFQDRQREDARAHNRITVPLTILLFDAFILGEMKAAPEIVQLSIWLRFVLVTPLTILFVLVDWRRATNRWSGAATALLLVLPTLLSAIESAHTTSLGALSNYQAVPLIQLALLTCRMRVALVIVSSVTSTLLFGWIVLTASFIPASQTASLLLTDIAIAITVLVFAIRLEFRDRQVFLLNLVADIKNEQLGRQNLTLAKLTQVDALTGLGNRRCFDETLAALWADERVRHADVALIMFDIDCFKLFNDGFGHQAGDECLATLSHAAAHCLRDDRDTLVRYGGEEFAIVLPSTSLAEGWSVAERVRQAALDRAVPQAAGAPSHIVTISLGVACVKPSEQSAAALIEAADRRLYAAKRGGRNRTMAEEMTQEFHPFAIDRPLVGESGCVASGSSVAVGTCS